jgi:hypothetical protein
MCIYEHGYAVSLQKIKCKQPSEEVHRQMLADILVYSIPFLYYITSAYFFCQAKHTQAGEEQDEKDPRTQIDRIATNLDVDKVV